METKIIDELLEDKRQIVTYKYLTSKLDIHPNKAKQLLKDYVSKLPDDKKYSTTIVIGGTFKENDEFCVVLAYDDHVETMRRRFKHIDFEHLYSIQPISRFDDINNALNLADCSLNYASLPSSISRKEKRNISEHQQCVETKVDIDLSSNKITEDTSNKAFNNQNNETKVEDKIKLDKTQKAGVDFFAKKTNGKNSKLEVVEKKASPKKGSPKKVSPKIASPKKNNSDFFTKFKKPNNSDVPTANSKNEVLVENVIKDNRKLDIESPKKKVLENLPSKEKDAKKSKKVNENKNKKKNSQKVKRKRIQTFDSSEEEEEEEEVDSEEEDKKRSEHAMDVEEEIDIVQPTPPRPTPREYRKKEKQTITSTFIDEDGFICTKKEEKIIETEIEPLLECIENVEFKQLNTEPALKKMKSCQPDTAEHVNKKKGKAKPSKNTSCQGMKQSSLTSFFKTK